MILLEGLVELKLAICRKGHTPVYTRARRHAHVRTYTFKHTNTRVVVVGWGGSVGVVGST